MNVRWDSAHGMKIDVVLRDYSVFDERPEVGFELGRDEWQIVLRVPGDMKIDLTVGTVGHMAFEHSHALKGVVKTDHESPGRFNALIPPAN